MSAEQQPLLDQLNASLSAAVVEAFGADFADTDPILRASNNPKFGDFQANLAMSLAKKLGQKPRDVAEAITAKLPADGLFEKTEIAGPGFINLTLKTESLNQAAAMALSAPIVSADPAKTVVVDYSSPNVAKEMHVGHLRSTIIGDAIARVLSAQGHSVIRQNHLGDWGTQFGMLIENLLDNDFDPSPGAASGGVGELTKLYQEAKKRFDDEPDFVDRARSRVVMLQAGDEKTVAVWRALVESSKAYFTGVYGRLNVLLVNDDVRGESFYNDRLPKVIERLEAEGNLKESQGAKVVYPEGFTDREGDPMPMIVKKSDGGYLYATTDLAAASFRVDELGANRIIYCIGLPQKQHVEMFTQVLRQCGWIGDDNEMDFAGFGSVLGPDKKMFKTREGGTVKLAALIDEAEKRAYDVVKTKTDERGDDLSDDELKNIAHVVSIGALKYADLSSDRVKDYVFDWDRMLSFEGNTAPYLINAYVRIRSIFRKGGVETLQLDGSAIAVEEPAERALVLILSQFSMTVQSVAGSLEPHRMCNYLYELAAAFHKFYEACPVLKDGVLPEVKASRLALCAAVANTLKAGLELLGIETVERM